MYTPDTLRKLREIDACIIRQGRRAVEDSKAVLAWSRSFLVANGIRIGPTPPENRQPRTSDADER